MDRIYMMMTEVIVFSLEKRDQNQKISGILYTSNVSSIIQLRSEFGGGGYTKTKTSLKPKKKGQQTTNGNNSKNAYPGYAD